MFSVKGAKRARSVAPREALRNQETCGQNGLSVLYSAYKHNPMDRSSCWSLTINNPEVDDYQAIEEARSRGWKVEGQLEKGENGTPHLQLMLRTPQVRFAAVKKAFPRAHIEIAKSPVALAKYVSKEETRVAQLPADNRYYPSQSAYFRLVYDFFLKHNFTNLDTDEWRSSSRERWWKDAMYCDPPIDVLYEMEPNDRCERMLRTDLNNWEFATRCLIEDGFHVEHHWVNPQVKSAIRTFGWAILKRSWVETDRQTALARLEQEVEIPTIEHNHAEVSASSS